MAKTKKAVKKSKKAKTVATVKAEPTVKKEAKKVKITWVTPYDFNPDNQVGANGTPTKIWAQFPCNASNQARIDEYMRSKGIKTYAHLAQVLIAEALGLK